MLDKIVGSILFLIGISVALCFVFPDTVRSVLGSAQELREMKESSTVGQVSGASNRAQPSELVQEIQKELIALGFNPGSPDGLMGQNTERAIQKFQRENGMDTDGKASEDLLRRMRVTQKSTSAKPKPSASPEDNEWYILNSGLVCEPGDPREILALAQLVGQSVSTRDKKEGGRVVYTEVVALDGSSMSFYRGKSRCERELRDRVGALDRYN